MIVFFSENPIFTLTVWAFDIFDIGVEIIHKKYTRVCSIAIVHDSVVCSEVIVKSKRYVGIVENFFQLVLIECEEIDMENVLVSTRRVCSSYSTSVKASIEEIVSLAFNFHGR